MSANLLVCANSFAVCQNYSTQIGARVAAIADPVHSLAAVFMVLPSVHPPKLNPTIIVCMTTLQNETGQYFRGIPNHGCGGGAVWAPPLPPTIVQSSLP